MPKIIGLGFGTAGNRRDGSPFRFRSDEPDIPLCYVLLMDRKSASPVSKQRENHDQSHPECRTDSPV